MKIASAYLYDVTDGHFFMENIEIRDNRDSWGSADYRIYASNDQWPQANTNGIWHGSDTHVYLPRVFSRDGSWHWDQDDAARTTIHEWGHYGLGLKDEYEDRQSDDPSYCSTNYSTEPTDATRACFMNYELNTTEMCSDLAADPHRTDTEQDAYNHESCWETVVRKYADSADPDRWTFRTPTDRGQKADGPTALPCAAWINVRIVNANTGACAPFGLWWSEEDGDPAVGADVWIDRSGPDLGQGKTDANGYIEIIGAHDGETVRAQLGDASGHYHVACSPGSAAAQARTQPVPLQTDPFNVTVAVYPQGESAIQVRVLPSVALDSAPVVTMWQAGAEQGVPVGMNYDSGLGAWIGTAALDTALGRAGQVEIAATAQGQTVHRLASFSVEPAVTTEVSEFYSGDGFFELTLQPGSLPSDTLVSIVPGSEGSREQGSLVRVSAAYEIIVASGVYGLTKPSNLAIRFNLLQTENVLTDTLKVYHWDRASRAWVSDGGAVDAEQSWVAAKVDHLSTFAILGERIGASKVYLPIVLKMR